MSDPVLQPHEALALFLDPDIETNAAAVTEPAPRETLFSPLTGERLTERQVLALAFSREPIQRQRPIPEAAGREILRPTPGGKAWALLPSMNGRAWFPVERLTE